MRERENAIERKIFRKMTKPCGTLGCRRIPIEKHYALYLRHFTSTVSVSSFALKRSKLSSLHSYCFVFNSLRSDIPMLYDFDLQNLIFNMYTKKDLTLPFHLKANLKVKKLHRWVPNRLSEHQFSILPKKGDESAKIYTKRRRLG